LQQNQVNDSHPALTEDINRMVGTEIGIDAPWRNSLYLLSAAIEG